MHHVVPPRRGLGGPALVLIRDEHHPVEPLPFAWWMVIRTHPLGRADRIEAVLPQARAGQGPSLGRGFHPGPRHPRAGYRTHQSTQPHALEAEESNPLDLVADATLPVLKIKQKLREIETEREHLTERLQTTDDDLSDAPGSSKPA